MKIGRSGVTFTPAEWEQIVTLLGDFQALHNAYYKGKRPPDEVVSHMYNASLDALDILNGTKAFAQMKDEVQTNG